jgi:hypothetical protein
VAAALLVVAAGTLVAVGWLVASAVYDYSLQSHLIQVQQANHGVGSMAGMAGMSGAATTAGGTAATAAPVGTMSTAEMLQSTLALHLRGIAYAGGLVLLTNLLLVGWVVALRGADWSPRTGRDREPVPARA